MRCMDGDKLWFLSISHWLTFSTAAPHGCRMWQRRSGKKPNWSRTKDSSQSWTTICLDVLDAQSVLFQNVTCLHTTLRLLFCGRLVHFAETWIDCLPSVLSFFVPVNPEFYLQLFGSKQSRKMHEEAGAICACLISVLNWRNHPNTHASDYHKISQSINESMTLWPWDVILRIIVEFRYFRHRAQLDFGGIDTLAGEPEDCRARWKKSIGRLLVRFFWSGGSRFSLVFLPTSSLPF